jgi:hypothetical protein
MVSPSVQKGKKQAAKTVASSIMEIYIMQMKNPIKISWKEKQTLEGANTVNNNVVKNGDQIIHEQQA